MKIKSCKTSLATLGALAILFLVFLPSANAQRISLASLQGEIDAVEADVATLKNDVTALQTTVNALPGINPGTSPGQLLTWDGNNWIAENRPNDELVTLNNMQPYQVINFVIALQGIFPSRNSEPFIGEIKMGGWNFAPRGYALCDGQLLSIAQNSALFALLGTQYGGDGRTTFGLPDLRGRVPVHAGNGPGLTQRQLGEKGGQEENTFTDKRH